MTLDQILATLVIAAILAYLLFVPVLNRWRQERVYRDFLREIKPIEKRPWWKRLDDKLDKEK